MGVLVQNTCVNECFDTVDFNTHFHVKVFTLTSVKASFVHIIYVTRTFYTGGICHFNSIQSTNIHQNLSIINCYPSE